MSYKLEVMRNQLEVMRNQLESLENLEKTNTRNSKFSKKSN